MRILRFLVTGALLVAGGGRPAAAQLTIRFVNVGQGDAILLEAPDGKKALIDAGPDGSFITSYLRQLHVDTLALVVASHNHQDHIGGMPGVLGTFTVRKYLENGIPQRTGVYKKTEEALKARGIPVLKPERQDMTLGPVQLHVLSLPPLKWPNQEDQNYWSIGLQLQYGQFHALLTGDAELQELQYWLSHDVIEKVQLLKVANHGRATASTTRLADATRPTVAVVSVGAHNPWGDPDKTVLELWSQVAVRVFRTDRDKGITVTADSTGAFRLTTEAAPSCTLEFSTTGGMRPAGDPAPTCR